eukprot:12476775-Heterocapsa_arctica.AAC.1
MSHSSDICDHLSQYVWAVLSSEFGPLQAGPYGLGSYPLGVFPFQGIYPPGFLASRGCPPVP